MRATRWLAVSLSLALAEAQGNFIAPGVLLRPKRQGASILFPDSSFPPFEPSMPFPHNGGAGMFAPLPQPPSVVAFPENADAHPEDDPDAALVLPDDLDLNTMDHVSLSLINSIDNITVFAELFGIQLPVDENADLNFKIGARSGNEIVAAEMAQMASCKPELRTVPLDLPVEANTLFYPTCVRLEQCGGCCFGPLLTCRPKVTKAVKFKVLKTVVRHSTNSARSRTTNRRRGRRRRRQSVPSFYEVEATKHVQCECGCKVREQDCNPAIQNYVEGECSCVCKRRDEKKKCQQQSDSKYWDNDSCACYCRRSIECGTGEFFSQDSCKCERLVARSGFPVDTFEDHIERRKPFERPHRRRPVRPVRIPLQPPKPESSRRPTLLTMIHSPRHHQPSF